MWQSLCGFSSAVSKWKDGCQQAFYRLLQLCRERETLFIEIISSNDEKVFLFSIRLPCGIVIEHLQWIDVCLGVSPCAQYENKTLFGVLNGSVCQILFFRLHIIPWRTSSDCLTLPGWDFTMLCSLLFLLDSQCWETQSVTPLQMCHIKDCSLAFLIGLSLLFTSFVTTVSFPNNHWPFLGRRNAVCVCMCQ